MRLPIPALRDAPPAVRAAVAFAIAAPVSAGVVVLLGGVATPASVAAGLGAALVVWRTSRKRATDATPPAP